LRDDIINTELHSKDTNYYHIISYCKGLAPAKAIWPQILKVFQDFWNSFGMGEGKKRKIVLALILLWMFLLCSSTSTLKGPLTKGKPHGFHWGYYRDNCLPILCSKALWAFRNEEK